MNTKNSLKMTNEEIEFMNVLVEKNSQEIDNIMSGYYDKFNPDKLSGNFHKPKPSGSLDIMYN